MNLRYVFVSMFLCIGVIYIWVKYKEDILITPPKSIIENSSIEKTIDENLAGRIEPIGILHVSTPSEVHGIYISGWSAGTKKSMDRILGLIDQSNINTVVIDIKDATGKLSYQPLDQLLLESKVGTNRISNLKLLIDKLHDRGIYIIGRISVFQDPYFTLNHTDEAFKDSRTNGLWNDNKRITWLRPDSNIVWDYIVSIAKDAHSQGFDEINLDYVRFPSDGPLMYLYPKYTAISRVSTIESFFQYIDSHLRSEGIVVSADVFGLTTLAKGDIGIGQKLEVIAPYVDFICPMIYPSHFGVGSYGYTSPSRHPYEIINKSLKDGLSKLDLIGIDNSKMRPWLQDFDLLGIKYTSAMVAAEIMAASEVGVNSWLMWDPKNTYTGLIPR